MEKSTTTPERNRSRMETTRAARTWRPAGASGPNTEGSRWERKPRPPRRPARPSRVQVVLPIVACRRPERIPSPKPGRLQRIRPRTSRRVRTAIGAILNDLHGFIAYGELILRELVSGPKPGAPTQRLIKLEDWLFYLTSHVFPELGAFRSTGGTIAVETARLRPWSTAFGSPSLSGRSGSSGSPPATPLSSHRAEQAGSYQARAPSPQTRSETAVSFG